jgi:putative endonuclease
MKLGLKLKNKTNHRAGLDAEELAMQHLRQQAFDVLEIRYKCKYGEIDIIAQKENLLIFVEVKNRKNFGEDDPISQNQKNRITNTALQYLSDNPEKNEMDMRFDSILVDSTNSLNHIIDSWRLEQ